MTGALVIRRSTPEDAAWVLPLSARLHDFGPPSWRPRAQMDRAVAASIGEALHGPAEGQVVLIAEDEHGAPAGFIHLHPAVDFFTHEMHTHVSDIVVVPSAEGRGVRRLHVARLPAGSFGVLHSGQLGVMPGRRAGQ